MSEHSHSHHHIQTTNNNYDRDYIQKVKEYNTAKKISQPMLGFRGDNQYIFVYMRDAFLYGALFGSAVGVISGTYYRKFSRIPTYALGFGASYALYHGAAAYFRNEV